LSSGTGNISPSKQARESSPSKLKKCISLQLLLKHFSDDALIRDLQDQMKGRGWQRVVTSDRVHSGVKCISKANFKSCIAFELGYKCEALMDRIFQLADVDGDDVLSVAELERLSMSATSEITRASERRRKLSSPSWIPSTHRPDLSEQGRWSAVDLHYGAPVRKQPDATFDSDKSHRRACDESTDSEVAAR